MDRPLQSLRNSYTLAAIGKAAGVSKQAVGQWKRVPLSRLSRLAKNLGKSALDLRPDLGKYIVKPDR